MTPFPLPAVHRFLLAAARCWQAVPRMALLVLCAVLWLGDASPAQAQVPGPAEGVVRLHFHRPTNDYIGWGLHVWGFHLRLPRDVSWERPLEPAGVDAFGVYFDVPVEPASRGFNFIVHRGETKSYPKDQELELARHGREVWLLENTETVFTSAPPVQSDFTVGIETEQKVQRSVLLIWGSAAVVGLGLLAAVWFLQRRVASSRSSLAAQLAQVVEAQQQMRQRADRPGALDDELTGLPTRSGLHQALEQALGRAKRGGDRMAVLFVDLDGFKAVNDTAGHDAGDHVLKVLAQRFKQCLRESDMVARVGGDEFVVVLESLHSPLHAAQVARKLTAAARLPIERMDAVHQVGASIGIAVYPQDGDDAATLIKGADTAMYTAKKLGKNGSQFLQADCQRQMDELTLKEQSLRDALERRELRLEYLPDLDIAGGRVLAASAIPRWPGDGRPMPLKDLFDLTQDEVLAGRLNHWMLAEASRQAGAWRDAGLPPVRIAVTLLGDTAPALSNAHRQLTGDRAAAHALLLQLPSSLLDDRKCPREYLDAMHALGVGLSLAGLGVQDLSLLRLIETPVDVIKIDVPKFIADGSPAADGLARSLVSLGKTRAFRVVACGVDNPAQREWARRMGCMSSMTSASQGPLPAASIADLLARHQAARSTSGG